MLAHSLLMRGRGDPCGSAAGGSRECCEPLVGLFVIQQLVFSGLGSGSAHTFPSDTSVDWAAAPINLPPPPPPITDAQRVPVPAYGQQNGIWPSDASAFPAPLDPLSPVAAIAGDSLVPALGAANVDVYGQGTGVGAHVALEYPNDVNQKTDGWVDLPLILTATPDGWTNTNEGTTASFPTTLSTSTPIVESLPDGSIQIAPTDVKSAGALSGSTITYANAFSATDLAYSAVPGGYREELIMASTKAPTFFDYSIQTKGLTLLANEAGGIDILAGGIPVALLPTPLAYDSSADRAETVGTYGLKDMGAGAYDLTVTLDPAFMASATYPVTLDPGTSLRATERSGYVDSATPGTSYESSDWLKVSSTKRTFFNPDLGNLTRGDRIVYDATLNLWPSAPGGVSPPGICAMRVTDVWPAGGSLTWNTQPGVGTGCYDSTSSANSYGWWTWQLKALYQKIIDTNDPSGYVDHGVRLSGPDAKTFCSVHAPQPATCPTGAAPVLAITYNDLPDAPTLRSPANAYTSPTDSVTLKIQGGASWPADVNGDDVYVNFQVSDDGVNWTGSHLKYSSPFQDSASYTVPTGVLSDGKTYYWRAQSWDVCQASPVAMCSLTDGNNVTRTLNASASQTFSIAMQHLGTDSRYSMFSHDLGSGMTAKVNESNGNLFVDVPLASYPTQIGELGVGLTYDSQSAADYGLSPGWDVSVGDLTTLNLPVSLTPPPTSDDPASIQMRGSRIMYFPNLTGDIYETPGSGSGTVKQNKDNTWIYTTPDGSEYSFDVNGHLTKGKPAAPAAAASAGAAFTYTVDSNGHITRVTDPLSRQINLTWTSGKLTSVSTWTNQAFAIAYDGAGKMSTVDATVTATGLPTHHEIEKFTYLTSGTGTGLLGEVRDAAAQAVAHTGWTFTYSIDSADPKATVHLASLKAPPGGTSAPAPTPWSFSYFGTYFGTTASGSCLLSPDATSVPACTASSSAAAYQTKTLFNTSGLAIEIVSPPDQNGYAGITTAVWDSNNNVLCRRDPIANAVTLSCTDATHLDAGNVSSIYAYQAVAPYNLLTLTHPAPDRAGTQARLRQSYTYDGDSSFQGLWAEEFGNALLSGPPDWEELRTNMNSNWGPGAPAHITGSADYWSIRLTGYLNVPDFNGDGSAIKIGFRAYSNDGSTLSIGSKTLSDCFGAVQTMSTYNCTTNADTHRTLNPGPTRITFEFSELTGNAEFDIQWDQGNGHWQTIPIADTSPNLGLVTSVTDQSVVGSAVTDLAKTTETYNDPAGGDGYKARRLSDSTTKNDLGGSGAMLASVAAYDSFGRLTSSTDGTSPLTATTTNVYTDNSAAKTTCLTQATDPTGAVTSQACDSTGDLTSITQQIRATNGQPAQSRTTTTTYDSLGRTLTATPPIGGSTTTIYDLAGRSTEIQRVVSGTSVKACTDNVYDDAGHLLTQTQPDPDGNCRATDATPGDSPVTQFTWSWADHQLTMRDPNLNTWTSSYDGLGRVIQQKSPLNATTNTTYVLSATESSVDVTDPGGTDHLTKNDVLGRTSSTQLEALNPTTTSYDVLGDTTLVTDPAGVQTKSVYNNLSQLTSQTSAFGTSAAATTTSSYDALGRLASTNGPRTDVNDIESYDYDLAGHVTKVTSPGVFLPNVTTNPPTNSSTPVSVQVSYDDAGERVKVDQPMSMTPTLQTLTRNWTYDLDGRQVSYTDAEGTTNNTYDSVSGALTQVADPRPQSVFYGSDYLGRKVCRFTSACNVSTSGADTFTYDNAGHTQQANNPAASFNMTYDNDGR